MTAKGRPTGPQLWLLRKLTEGPMIEGSYSQNTAHHLIRKGWARPALVISPSGLRLDRMEREGKL